MGTIFRAIAAYFFLLMTVRLISRRPGGQMTPFELILIFLFGGITIQAVVADDRSITNAFLAVITISLMHVLVAWLKQQFPSMGRLFDGVPVVLVEKGNWRSESMNNMRIQPMDVMAAAREKGLRSLKEVDYAILERNGEITVFPRQDNEQEQSPESQQDAA
jgi:uncharacterized membrane protein YcaP (DUF421 family)